MLYGERDFYGLQRMFSLLAKYTYAIVAVIVAGLFVFSAAFLNSYGMTPDADTVLAFRVMLFALPFCSMTRSFRILTQRRIIQFILSDIYDNDAS